ncbi:MAG TPA: glycosyl hydrolase [Candidatus Acidoferrales bacterium]|nr:glycosyl hydrolase [Candidatus Acidoferrales bacterium]
MMKATFRRAIKAVARFLLSAIPVFALVTLLHAQPAGTMHLVAPPEPVPADFFGMHIHRVADATPWPMVAVPAWRLWDAHAAWPDLEPVKGRWMFNALDKYLALAAEHHTRVLLPLGLSPQWASARPEENSVYHPGYAAEPRDMEDWRNYVTAVATHCKGRVAAYEIWNEPNEKGFWTGDTDRMVALTREAAAIVHKIDPHALVVSPSATMNAGVDWLTQFLRQGGGQYVDAIGFHFYVAPRPPEAMVPLIQRVKQVMEDAGVGEKPLWNTETGWMAPKPFPSEDLGAAYLARAFILNWAAGARAFYWYAWDNHTWVSLQTTEADSRTLRPAGRAYKVIQEWMAGAALSGCNQDAEHTWTCQLTRAGVTRWIVWNELGDRSFQIPAAWHARTATPLLGEPQAIQGAKLEIGQAPVLVAG